MNILRQSKKVRRHIAMMTLVLLMLLPFVASATMLAVMVITSGTPEGIAQRTLIVAILSLPIVFLVWGALLLSHLGNGFISSIRKRLFTFYVTLLAYCGAWMAVPWSYGDTTFVLLPPPGVLIVTLLLAIPSFATMLTHEDFSEQAGTSNGG
jgi:hypothetical protein